MMKALFLMFTVLMLVIFSPVIILGVVYAILANKNMVVTVNGTRYRIVSAR